MAFLPGLRLLAEVTGKFNDGRECPTDFICFGMKGNTRFKPQPGGFRAVWRRVLSPLSARAGTPGCGPLPEELMGLPGGPARRHLAASGHEGDVQKAGLPAEASRRPKERQNAGASRGGSPGRGSHVSTQTAAGQRVPKGGHWAAFFFF